MAPDEETQSPSKRIRELPDLPPAADIPTQPGMANSTASPLSNRTHPPSSVLAPVIVNDELLEARQRLRGILATHATTDKLEAVLEALFDRAVGDPDTGRLSSIPALKLWLEYTIGSPAALDTGERDRATPQLAEADYVRLERIAERHNKNLRHMVVVEVQEAVVEEEEEDASPTGGN